MSMYRGSKILRRLEQIISKKLTMLPYGWKVIVLGRVACLGRDVFELHPIGLKKNFLINQQKMRIDLWLDLVKGARPCTPKLVKTHLKLKDIYPLIVQQKHTPRNKYNTVQYLLMDSFSELTDQMFVHKKEGWSFCCHYSDIKHSTDFANEFECKGLLPVEKIHQAYSDFFNYFSVTFPNTQVIFLDFPASLDSREEFKKRADVIRFAIETIADRHSFIHFITIDQSDVIAASGDSFPYHFSTATKTSYVKKWV